MEAENGIAGVGDDEDVSHREGDGEWMEGVGLTVRVGEGGLAGEEGLSGLLARGNMLMEQDKFEEVRGIERGDRER